MILFSSSFFFLHVPGNVESYEHRKNPTSGILGAKSRVMLHSNSKKTNSSERLCNTSHSKTLSSASGASAPSELGYGGGGGVCVK